MEVRVLGPCDVIDDEGRTLALGGAKQRSVLAMLALQPNSALSVDAIAEGVWGEEIPDRYVQNVQVYVSTLRKLIEPHRTRGMPSRIMGRGTGYELVAGPDDVDLLRFRRHVGEAAAAGDQHQPATAAAAFRRALEVWRGEPCEDLVFQPFATNATRPLLEERWSAFERCIDAELASGAGSGLVAELERAIDLQPLRERLWEQLAVALYRAGRQADALGAIRRAREYLVDELGIDAGPGLRLLEQQLLEQDAALDAPRGASMRAARVPVPLTSLLGRERLIESIHRSLDDRRLVVLTGPGGVGKTHAALTAVHARAAGSGAVKFVDLSLERDIDEVLPLIAKAAGLGAEASVAEVSGRLEQDDSMLLIDNFEQVVEAAPLLGAILEGARTTRALVTSRVQLGIPGERVIEVEPLPVSERADEMSIAARLFVERASEADPLFVVDGLTAEIETICRAVDGMPLAIELAASRTRVVGLRELARRIDSAVHGASRRTGSDRHRSMQAAIEWSIDLLESGERALFAALGVCEGAVDLATVVAIGGGAGLDGFAAEAGLDALVRASLLRSIETPSGRRFAFLTPIRGVARDRLRLGDEHPIRDRHAEWFVERAENMARDEGHFDPSTLATCVADLRDTAAAIGWLAGHGAADRAVATLTAMYTLTVVEAGEFSIMRTLADELRDGEIDPASSARLAVVAGGMAYMASDFTTAAAQLALTDGLAADDHPFRARGAMWLAVLCADQGDRGAALEHAAEALAHARASGRTRLIGLAMSAASYTALTLGDAPLALQRAQERLAFETEGGLGHVNAMIEVSLALVELDRIDEALPVATAAVVAARRLGIPQPRGDAFRCLAWCALAAGDAPAAAGYLLEQLAVFGRADGMIDRVLEVVLGAALVLLIQGDVGGARILWERGQALHTTLDVVVGTWPPPTRELITTSGFDAIDASDAGGDLSRAVADAAATLRAVVAADAAPDDVRDGDS